MYSKHFEMYETADKVNEIKILLCVKDEVFSRHSNTLINTTNE